MRQEWLQVGLALRTDWSAIRRILPALYAAAGLQPPESIVTLDSPLEGLLAAARTTVRLRWGPLDIRNETRSRVRREVSRAVTAGLRKQVRACLTQESEQVQREVRDQIRARLRSELAHLLFNTGEVAFGLHEAPWLAICDFFSRIGLEGLSSAAPWMELARAGAGWWWPFDGLAIVTSAPSVLNRDSEHRLHCESGPALAYPDGWAIWAIHGVLVPRRVVTEPQSLGLGEIAYEPDLGIRRVMLERFGYERFVREAGLEPIQADPFGHLYRLALGSTEPIALVEVLDGTPERDGARRRHFLCVPPTARTAHEAVAWTFGLRRRQYRPYAET